MNTNQTLGLLLAVAIIAFARPAVGQPHGVRVPTEVAIQALDDSDDLVVRGAIRTLGDRPEALTPDVIAALSRVAVTGSVQTRRAAREVLESMGSKAGRHLHSDFTSFRSTNSGHVYNWLLAVAATGPPADQIADSMVHNGQSLSLTTYEVEAMKAAVDGLTGNRGGAFAEALEKANDDKGRVVAARLWSMVPRAAGGPTLKQVDRALVNPPVDIIARVATSRDLDRLVANLSGSPWINELILTRLGELGPKARRTGPRVCLAMRSYPDQLGLLGPYLDGVGYGPELGCLAYLVGNSNARKTEALYSRLGQPGMAFVIRDLMSSSADRERAFRALTHWPDPPWVVFDFVKDEVHRESGFNGRLIPSLNAIEVWGMYGDRGRGRLRELAEIRNGVGRAALAQLGKADEQFLMRLVRDQGNTDALKRLVELEADPSSLSEAFFAFARQEHTMLEIELPLLGEAGARDFVEAVENASDASQIVEMLKGARLAGPQWIRPPGLTELALQLTSHQDDEVRHEALTSFWSVTPEEGAAAVPALRQALKRPGDIKAALIGAEQIGSAAAALTPEIIPLLDDPEHRTWALNALRAAGGGANEALPKLLRMARDEPDEPAILWAIGGVMTPDDTQAFELLFPLVGGDNRTLAMPAAAAVARHSKKPREILKARGVYWVD